VLEVGKILTRSSLTFRGSLWFASSSGFLNMLLSLDVSDRSSGSLHFQSSPEHYTLDKVRGHDHQQPASTSSIHEYSTYLCYDFNQSASNHEAEDATPLGLAQSQSSESLPGPSTSIPEDPPMQLAPVLPMAESIHDNEFSLDSPTTQIGQKRKPWDLNAILQVCICRQIVTEGEISGNQGIIRCKKLLAAKRDG
jgi:hypothetical protein